VINSKYILVANTLGFYVQSLKFVSNIFSLSFGWKVTTNQIIFNDLNSISLNIS